MSFVIEKAHIAVMWLASKANRLRIRGARVEVIAVIVARLPMPSVLLVESAYNNAWMPPQEGVWLSEKLKDAFYRCVNDECGIRVPQEEDERRKLFYVRDIQYLDIVDLPRDRWGERLVADDAVDTPLASIRMKKKAYWAAIAIVGNTSDINPAADGREVMNVRWTSLENARELVETSNRAEKAAVILKALDLCSKLLKVIVSKVNRLDSDALPS